MRSSLIVPRTRRDAKRDDIRHMASANILIGCKLALVVGLGTCGDPNVVL